jgi:5'-nucleotidase
LPAPLFQCLLEGGVTKSKINIMKKFVLLFIAIVVFGCKKDEQAPPPPPAATPITSGHEIVVVATNDFHAALQRAEGLASVIRSLRKKYGDHMVYLDGGDQFQGSLEGNMNKGEAVVNFFNLLGLDAAALGNHEFDYGPDVPKRVSVEPGEDGMGSLKTRIAHANYPFLSANFVADPKVSCEPGSFCNALGEKTIFEPRKIFQRNGERICVVGATTPTTANITNPDFLKGERFEEMAPVLHAEVNYLHEKQNCDRLILDLHEGFRYEADGKTLKNTGLLPVIKSLPPGSVDAVVGGHSHIRIQQVINGIPILQTGTGGQNVGVLHLIRDGDKRTFRFEPYIPVPDTAVAFDVTSTLLIYRQKAFQYKREVIGSTIGAFPQDKISESALGNLMADAVLQEGKKQGRAEFALMNAGGIRSQLPLGKITFDHVFRLMPFDNNLVVAELKGSELLSLLQIAFSETLGMPSISGLRVTCLKVAAGVHGPWERDLNGDGKKDDWERNLIVAVQDVAGHPIDPDKTYRLATNSFLADGGDFQDVVYDKIPAPRVHVYSILIRDILTDYVKIKSPLRPQDYYSADRSRIKLVLPANNKSAS